MEEDPGNSPPPSAPANPPQLPPPLPQGEGLAALTVPPLPSPTPLVTTPPRTPAVDPVPCHTDEPPTPPHRSEHPPQPPPSGISNSSASLPAPQSQSTKTTHTARRARSPPLSHRRPPTPTPSSSSLAEEPERSNRNLHHAHKRRICEISDANPDATQNDVVDLFFAETGRRLERSTVSRILRQKQLWKRAGATDAARKRFGPPRYPAVEAALFELIRNRSRDDTIRRTLADEELISLARLIAAAILEHMPSNSKQSQTYAPLIRNFCGSRSWLSYFKKRWALSSREETSGASFIDPQSGNMRFSEDHLRDSFNIWSKRLNIHDTVELLSNWSRMEDLYVLDALVLSTDALPDHAKKAVPRSDRYAPGVPNLENPVVPNFFVNRRDGTDDDIADTSDADQSVGGPPSISGSNVGDSESARLVREQCSSAQGSESRSGFQRDAMFMFEGEDSVVDDDNVAVLLLGTNATGNDFKAPWMVGKVPIGRLGKREGEVWRDCSVRYFHNSRGWLSANIIHSWIKEFDDSLDRSVLLVSSLFSLCDLDLLDLKYVTLLPVPRTEPADGKSAALDRSNVSNSPIHLGIEQSFRARYRSLVVERALKFMSHKQQIQSPCLEASAHMIEKAWRKVTSSDVRRAWHNLHYVPMRFRRPSRPRLSVQHKHVCVEELKRHLLNYREALDAYSKLDNVDVDRAGVECAIDDVSEYVWLSREPSVFHPFGSVLDFARVAVQENTKESVEEPFGSKGSKHKVFPTVESAAEAFEAANQLAQFVVKQPGKVPEEVIQWIGNVQLAMKRMRDEKRNEDIEKEWGSFSKRPKVT